MDTSMEKIEKIQDANSEILLEYDNARDKFREFASYHEGYGALLEEVDELWDAIKDKEQGPDRIRKEAKQVAAMALGIMVEEPENL